MAYYLNKQQLDYIEVLSLTSSTKLFFGFFNKCKNLGSLKKNHVPAEIHYSWYKRSGSVEFELYVLHIRCNYLFQVFYDILTESSYLYYMDNKRLH